jgi:hypothetical protein
MKTLSIFGFVFGAVVALVGGTSIVKGLGWAKNDKTGWFVVALGVAAVAFGLWMIRGSF